MKYKCLVFDHDDTVVASTATIHWPCFVEYLKEYYPGKTISLEEYFVKNFSPGFIEMCRDDYGMSDADLEVEVRFWQDYVARHVPKAYDGIKEIMERQKAEGGKIAVISHSFDYNILRDYEKNGLPKPDIIYGWEQPPERRKPASWPLRQVLSSLDIKPSEVLVIDDLKPGYDMAAEAGVPFAAAGWANDIPEIEKFMRSNCEWYFKTVDEFASFLSEDESE